MDQSGVLDRVEEHIAKYDTNKDGTFSVAEVKAIVEELEKEEQQTKALKKVCGSVPLPRRGAHRRCVAARSLTTNDTRRLSAESSRSPC